MCGRISGNNDNSWFGWPIRQEGIEWSRYGHEIRPTDPYPILVQNPEDQYEALVAKWGLIPHWTRDPRKFRNTFNARAESLLEKPAFQKPFASQRCLIPVRGFLEWGDRSAHEFVSEQGRGFMLAGLHDTWSGVEGTLRTFAIVTCPSNAFMDPYHHRMPLILGRRAAEKWLNPHTPIEQLVALLQPCPSTWLKVAS